MTKVRIHIRFGMTDQAYCTRYVFINYQQVLPNIDDFEYAFVTMSIDKFCKQCVKKYRK